MATTGSLQFYRARAAQARDEADAATLEHVRERCRRSEAAWNELADRASRSEQLKIRSEQYKADQILDQLAGEAQPNPEEAGNDAEIPLVAPPSAEF